MNSSLDIIAQANAEKKRDAMKKELQKLIRSMSAMEQVSWQEALVIRETALMIPKGLIHLSFIVFHQIKS